MNRQITCIFSLLFVLILSLTARAQTERVIMLLVNGPHAGWTDGDLDGKLRSLFTTKNKFHIVTQLETEVLAAELEGGFCKEELINRGAEINCRYVIWCNILKEDMAVEKHFSIPLVVKQRRVTATLEVDYRVVDCFRGKIVHTDRFVSRKFGPSTLQHLDYTDADPNLYVSYFERKQLFDHLEEEAAGSIFNELERIAKQR